MSCFDLVDLSKVVCSKKTQGSHSLAADSLLILETLLLSPSSLCAIKEQGLILLAVPPRSALQLMG